MGGLRKGDGVTGEEVDGITQIRDVREGKKSSLLEEPTEGRLMFCFVFFSSLSVAMLENFKKNA